MRESGGAIGLAAIGLTAGGAAGLGACRLRRRRQPDRRGT